jgi:hypothetical protein
MKSKSHCFVNRVVTIFGYVGSTGSSKSPSKGSIDSRELLFILQYVHVRVKVAALL